MSAEVQISVRRLRRGQAKGLFRCVEPAQVRRRQQIAEKSQGRSGTAPRVQDARP